MIMNEKVYIVISHYKMLDNCIALVIFDTKEEALKEATSDLEREYTISVDIYEADRADFCFFGKRVFNHVK